MDAVVNIGGITMPAGEYVVGDPCYSVPDSRWMEWLRASNYDQPEGRRYLYASLDGYAVLGIGTAYGDGEYVDQDGNLYGVDAGLIGLVPVEIAENDTERRVTFSEPFECFYDDGTIVLGNIRIPTDFDYDDDDDPWGTNWDDEDLDEPDEDFDS